MAFKPVNIFLYAKSLSVFVINGERQKREKSCLCYYVTFMNAYGNMASSAGPADLVASNVLSFLTCLFHNLASFPGIRAS
jgi:hypothetical protein